MWKSLSGVPIADVVDAVRALVGDGDRVIHVGTDAQHRGHRTDFVTAVAVLAPGRGARVFYKRERVPRTPSLAHKLFREVELSLDVANRMRERIDQEIFIHVDANEDPIHRSSKYVQALSGMVVGYGFRVQVKPYSWCATHVADYVVKEKHLKAA